MTDTVAATAHTTKKTIRPGRQHQVIDWPGCIPFVLIHLGCFLTLWAGFSWTALWVAFTLYLIRGWSITAGYHRYFSHRAFKTSRFFQFILAFMGATATQMGPLWWAAHHRGHHRYSDTDLDVHSPVSQGFWWSHMGWIMSRRNYRAVNRYHIADFAVFPELRWMDRWCLVAPSALIALLWFTGDFLARTRPELGTSGFQLFVWGFLVSTTVVYHTTFSVNSFTHIFGKKRFETGDRSLNNPWVALVALGEGWHNNHHKFPYSERQGIYWWEFDFTHYVLKALSWTGLVWDLRGVSKEALAEALK